jgi:hypothetical protein
MADSPQREHFLKSVARSNADEVPNERSVVIEIEIMSGKTIAYPVRTNTSIDYCVSESSFRYLRHPYFATFVRIYVIDQTRGL